MNVSESLDIFSIFLKINRTKIHENIFKKQKYFFVEKKNYKEINFKDFKGIIFTSSNAIKFLNIKDIDKKINCFCVGIATEKKARSSGFQNTFTAEGNVNNLKELILQNFNSSDGKILYVSGEILSSDLDLQLIKIGYNLKILA